MSYAQTLRILDKLSEDHDEEVKIWAEKLTGFIEKPPDRVSVCVCASALVLHAL